MAFFGIGSTLSSASPDAAAQRPAAGAPVGTDPGAGPAASAAASASPLGETGVEVFPLILGGAEFGWNVDLESSHEILDTYVELGGNAVHTADSFSGGRSEHIIGQWLRSRGLRDEIVLGDARRRPPRQPGSRPGQPRARGRGVADAPRHRPHRRAVPRRHGRLGHGARRHPRDRRVARRSPARSRALGAVGYTAAQLVEARIFASAGFPRITVLDVPFNVLRRHEFDADLRLVAGAQGMAVTPSHALEHGFLAGRHRTRTRGSLSVRGAQLAANLNRRGSRTLRALDAVGTELGVPDAAVAVAWLLAQKLVTAPIVNAYAAAARRRARAGRRRAAQPRAPRRHRARRRVTAVRAAGHRPAGDVGWRGAPREAARSRRSELRDALHLSRAAWRASGCRARPRRRAASRRAAAARRRCWPIGSRASRSTPSGTRRSSGRARPRARSPSGCRRSRRSRRRCCSTACRPA